MGHGCRDLSTASFLATAAAMLFPVLPTQHTHLVTHALKCCMGTECLTLIRTCAACRNGLAEPVLEVPRAPAIDVQPKWLHHNRQMSSRCSTCSCCHGCCCCCCPAALLVGLPVAPSAVRCLLLGCGIRASSSCSSCPAATSVAQLPSLLSTSTVRLRHTAGSDSRPSI